MISKVLEYKYYSKQQKILFFLFLIINWLNFGNYSFLFYSWNGLPLDNILLKIIRNGRIALPIILVLYLFNSNYWRSKILKIISKNLYLYLFCLFYIFNSVISSNILNSLTYSIWLLFSVLLINLTIDSTYSLRDTFILFKYGSIITVIFLIPSLPFLIVNNEASFFSSKNYYAYPILIYLLSEFYLLSYKNPLKKNKRKIIRICIIISLIVIMFLSGRRVALLFSLLGLGFFIYKSNKIIFMTVIFSVILFTPIIIATEFLGFKIEDSLTYKRFNRVSDYSDLNDSSYSEREIIWSYYILAFYDSPVIGNGINTSDGNLSRYYSGDLLGLSYHNSYLQILVEGGLFGFVFYLLYMFITTIRCFGKNNLFFIILFSSVIFVNWFESNLLPGQVFFTFSIGIFLIINTKK